MSIPKPKPDLISAQRPSSYPRRISNTGFTLLELMVSLAIGAIAITSVYAVGAASTQQFKEQQRVSNLQSSLRIAMDQIKRDVTRIAYQATANINAPGETCMATNNVVPVMLQEDADLGLVQTNDFAAGIIHADRLTMVGNYTTRSEYLVRGLATQPTGDQSAFLQTNWQSFRRDFVLPATWSSVNPAAELFDPQAFATVFLPGRWLRLQNQEGFKFFVTIQGTVPTSGTPPMSVSMATPRIDFTSNPLLPLGSECVGGLMSSAKAAPLSMIRYRLFDGTGNGTSTDDTLLNGDNVQLVREEIQPNNPAAPDPLISSTTANPNDNSRQILADYVVSFNISAVMDASAGTGVVTPCLYWFDNGTIVNPTGDGCEPTGAINFNANVAQVRSLIVELSVRTPEHDPRFLWPLPTGGQITAPPITRYRGLVGIAAGAPQIIPLPGASRVRTIRTEILVPNIAYN